MRTVKRAFAIVVVVAVAITITMSDHPWPESMRKRGRDDEEGELDGVANGPLGFTEHRNVSNVRYDML